MVRAADGPNAAGVLADAVGRVGIDHAGLPRTVDRRGVEVLGRLLLDAAGARGVVGDHRRQPAVGIVIVLGGDVLGGVGVFQFGCDLGVGVGCGDRAVEPAGDIVLDRNDGPSGGVVKGFRETLPALSVVSKGSPAEL